MTHRAGLRPSSPPIVLKTIIKDSQLLALVLPSARGRPRAAHPRFVAQAVAEAEGAKNIFIYLNKYIHACIGCVAMWAISRP